MYFAGSVFKKNIVYLILFLWHFFWLPFKRIDGVSTITIECGTDRFIHRYTCNLNKVCCSPFDKFYTWKQIKLWFVWFKLNAGSHLVPTNSTLVFSGQKKATKRKRTESGNKMASTRMKLESDVLDFNFAIIFTLSLMLSKYFMMLSISEEIWFVFLTS